MRGGRTGAAEPAFRRPDVAALAPAPALAPALDRYRRGRDSSTPVADLLYWLGILCQSGPGDQDLARLAAVVIDEADRDGNRRAEVIARSQLAYSLSQSWYLAEADVQAAAAVSVARGLPEPGYLLEALSVLSANHWRAGHDEESMRAAAEALRLLEDTGAGWEQLSEAQLNLSQSLCRVQRPQEARELAERGLALRRAHGDARALAYGLHATGMVLREAGFPDRAAACHREASDIHRGIGQHRRLGWSQLRLAEALSDQGVHDEALEAAGHAAETLTELGDRPGRGLALALVGRIRERLGDTAGARAAWQDAYSVFDGTSSPVTAELRKLLGLDAGSGGLRWMARGARRTGARARSGGGVAGPEPAGARRPSSGRRGCRGIRCRRGVLRRSGVGTARSSVSAPASQPAP